MYKGLILLLSFLPIIGFAQRGPSYKQVSKDPIAIAPMRNTPLIIARMIWDIGLTLGTFSFVAIITILLVKLIK